MPVDDLRIAAFVAYLAAWAVFALGAVVSAIPRVQRRPASPILLNAPVLIGTLLQIAPTLAFSLSLGNAPLTPTRLELAGILMSAVLGAALFVGSVLAAPRHEPRLVTRGVYAWIRHPIYLAFLAMLIATGLLVSAGIVLAAAIIVYLVGCEVRISSEEEDLARKFPGEYRQYRLQTPWRYLPGLR